MTRLQKFVVKLFRIQINPVVVDLHGFQKQVVEWTTRNFGGKYGSGYRPLIGAVEEVGELCHAQLKLEQGIRGKAEEHRAKMRDAIGDIMVFLADYCGNQEISMQECVSDTWNEVRQRDWKKFPGDGVSK